ncbi:hypothetical protein [Sinorhizobium meliloti]|uniref:phosphoribosyltransferase-like protein n=1 Tax=Rhizobium meliloti TaxID=382 RepID=UPI0003018940|nr:hypothetical protein [Sinorhizobium meliloti]UDU21090.1 hypothetical protein LJD24_18020 [Sinorhizobium meliloti]
MSVELVLDSLQIKLKQLTETIWREKISGADIKRWSEQFSSSITVHDNEQLQALFLLSNFIYFGQVEIRELLKSLYRDLYRTPAIHSIRRLNGDTAEWSLLQPAFETYRQKTRFLGVGNPSESGVHLLYYFRQENALPKSLFINSHEIFSRDTTTAVPTLKIADDAIETYVFIDDLCGSGTQASAYSKQIVEPLRALKPNVKVHYLMLFATTDGLEAIRALKRFDRVEAIYELDNTFKALEPTSRIFTSIDTAFDRVKIRATCQTIGSRLWPTHPLGYKDGQLLLGFTHNTPDNALPIFWMDGPATGQVWEPIFKRYHKDYN